MAKLRILFEDNHLLVVDKPARLATMGAESGADTLVRRAKAYLKRKYKKPGNVYLGVVSRLDAHVTGVIVLARTSKSAARLSHQFQNRDVDKRYWALVSGRDFPSNGVWSDHLVKNDAHRKMQVVAKRSRDSSEAETQFELMGSSGSVAWYELCPITGRKHQLRVQLAHRGLPILGDRKYGSRQQFEHGIALHARSITIAHPVRSERMTFEANTPPSWADFAHIWNQ